MNKAPCGVLLAACCGILARFRCLDHTHMTEPYHRLMAKEWLNIILGVPLSASAK